MIKNGLLLKIYEAANMQRWNDQIRAFEITELDKQAHKMIAAYVLGKYQESLYYNKDLYYNKNISKADNYNNTPNKNKNCIININNNTNNKINCSLYKIDWIKIIEYGLFEYLQRIVLTDLKPPLFYEIKKDRQKYKKLNQWVYERIYPFISCLGENFCSNFNEYITSEDNNDNLDINKQIIRAAHFYITKWEFDLISKFNPNGYQVEEINKSIEVQQQKYKKLPAMKKLLGSEKLTSFINICGQLRFQIRWSHIYRVPKTSVLGHMLIVAIFSYLFSYIAGLDKEQIKNNFFTGLFHDLPEVLTRDIINPVKKSVEGLEDLIKEYEKKEMEKRIYNLLPKDWQKDFKMFTENEFEDIQLRSGKLVKAADDISAYIEAFLCKKNGINNESLDEAMRKLEEKYTALPQNMEILGINFKNLYNSFKSEWKN